MGNQSHPYSPFDFQSTVFHPGSFEEDRRAWDVQKCGREMPRLLGAVH